MVDKKTENDFEKLYAELSKKKEIKEKEKRMNEYIKDDSRDTLKLTLIFVIVGIFCVLIMFNIICKGFVMETYITCFILVLILIIATIIPLSIFYGKKEKPRQMFYKKYKEEYKEEIIKRILNEFCNDIIYSYKKGIDIKTYNESEFDGQLYESDDYIEGTYNNSKFKIAEIYTRIKTNTEQEYYTFRGMLAKIELTKEFKEKVYLRMDYKVDENKDLKDLKVELDSDEFEKKFNIYATNKIVALQLLTPDIMEMLLDYSKLIIFEFTIKDGNLYIRFETGEMFERLSLDKEVLYRYYRILKLIFELTDKLQKNIKETQY